MPTMYDKPVRMLMQDMIPALGISPGGTFTREQAVHWFAENYPKIKQGTVAAHLIRLSTNVPTRLQYSVRSDGSDDHSTRSIAALFDCTNQEETPLRSRNPPLLLKSHLNHPLTELASLPMSMTFEIS